MMGLTMVSRPTIPHLRMVASIIEFRCANIIRVRKLLELDIEDLYLAKSQKTRDRICADIYNKLDYIETLLSKNIDDIMSMEIMEMDGLDREEKKPFSVSDIVKQDEYTHYIQ